MKTKLFTMMSVMIAFLAMFPTAIKAENPAGSPAPQPVYLQCTTSNASVIGKTVFGKPVFYHKVTVTINTGNLFLPAGKIIKYFAHASKTSSYTVPDQLGLPPGTSRKLGIYTVTLDEKEIPWPDGCSAWINN
jgi:hypothetical protein